MTNTMTNTMTNRQATRRGFFGTAAAALMLTSITSAHVQAQNIPLQGKYVPLISYTTTKGLSSSWPGLLEVGIPDVNQMQPTKDAAGRPMKDGWYYVGMLAHKTGGRGSRADQQLCLVVRKHPRWNGADPLTIPGGFSRQWGTGSAGGFGIFQATTVQKNYFAVGDIFEHNGSNPDSSHWGYYRMVHDSCVSGRPYRWDWPLWTDEGSGAKEDGSIWGATTEDASSDLQYSKPRGDVTDLWSLFKAGVNHQHPAGGLIMLNPAKVEIISGK